MACDCQGSYNELNNSLQLINSTLLTINSTFENYNKSMIEIDKEKNKIIENNTKTLEKMIDKIDKSNNDIINKLDEIINKNNIIDENFLNPFIEVYNKKMDNIIDKINLLTKAQEIMVLLNVELNIKGDERVSKIMGENYNAPDNVNDLKNAIDNAVKVLLNDVKDLK